MYLGGSSFKKCTGKLVVIKIAVILSEMVWLSPETIDWWVAGWTGELVSGRAGGQAGRRVGGRMDRQTDRLVE